MANIVKNDVKISVANSDVRVSVVIELNDVSEKDYEDILHYIKSRVNPVESEPEVEKRRASMDDLSDAINKLYDAYERNKKNYILKSMTSYEFLKAHPELGQISTTPIGKTLSEIARGRGIDRFPVERVMMYNPVTKRRAQANKFTVPVRCETMGKKIKAFCEMNHLSSKELSAGIGYPVTVVDAWLKDTSSPSSGAINAMIKIFGEDFKKAVGLEAE